jgi:hypothetical protein
VSDDRNEPGWLLPLARALPSDIGGDGTARCDAEDRSGIAGLRVSFWAFTPLHREVVRRAKRREIGIRIALGARPGDVVSHTLRGALSMLLAGLAVGLAGAFALTRALQSLLFEVSALDPAALAFARVLMTPVDILAALIPASRAAGVDPMKVLRNEAPGSISGNKTSQEMELTSTLAVQWFGRKSRLLIRKIA